MTKVAKDDCVHIDLRGFRKGAWMGLSLRRDRGRVSEIPQVPVVIFQRVVCALPATVSYGVVGRSHTTRVGGGGGGVVGRNNGCVGLAYYHRAYPPVARPSLGTRRAWCAE